MDQPFEMTDPESLWVFHSRHLFQTPFEEFIDHHSLASVAPPKNTPAPPPPPSSSSLILGDVSLIPPFLPVNVDEPSVFKLSESPAEGGLGAVEMMNFDHPFPCCHHNNNVLSTPPTGSPLLFTHFPDAAFVPQSSAAAGVARGSTICYPNRHFISGDGSEVQNNINNHLPSSSTSPPGAHADPVVITTNDHSYLLHQTVDDNGIHTNTNFDFSSQSQDISDDKAFLVDGEGVASQSYSEPAAITRTLRRRYRKWTNEEMDKLLGAISKFRQSRHMWKDVKKHHFCDDVRRSTNTLKQKFKEMCKAAMSSTVTEPKTMALYNRALMLRGQIQQEKGPKKYS